MLLLKMGQQGHRPVTLQGDQVFLETSSPNISTTKNIFSNRVLVPSF